MKHMSSLVDVDEDDGADDEEGDDEGTDDEVVGLAEGTDAARYAEMKLCKAEVRSHLQDRPRGVLEEDGGGKRSGGMTYVVIQRGGKKPEAADETETRLLGLGRLGTVASCNVEDVHRTLKRIVSIAFCRNDEGGMRKPLTLSDDTQSHSESFEKAMQLISALSLPLRSLATCSPVVVSHTRITVPCSDAVANRVPSRLSARQESGLSCALMGVDFCSAEKKRGESIVSALSS